MDFERLKRNFEKNGYSVSIFDTAKEAADYMVENIKGETVSIGGSATVNTMNVYDRLKENNKVYWHWVNVSDRDRYGEYTTYISSANAVAETGELVNIDGMGNRLAATLFGPKKMWFVVGQNKITEDLQSAIERARNVASPKNAARFGVKTPCMVDGKCHDCNSPDRICRAMVVYMRSMMGRERTELVVIKEDLGF